MYMYLYLLSPSFKIRLSTGLWSFSFGRSDRSRWLLCEKNVHGDDDDDARVSDIDKTTQASTSRELAVAPSLGMHMGICPVTVYGLDEEEDQSRKKFAVSYIFLDEEQHDI